ncbi:unnamed protein product [Soboliphyme baturini]|uniref:SURF1-like protein n=1 Tax=Soboliphyme baturini TaxID=241478 RepID=A0A183ILT7_9BILA|nr:unnamed protein product [Soboliphyme baturini]
MRQLRAPKLSCDAAEREQMAEGDRVGNEGQAEAEADADAEAEAAQKTLRRTSRQAGNAPAESFLKMGCRFVSVSFLSPSFSNNAPAAKRRLEEAGLGRGDSRQLPPLLSGGPTINQRLIVNGQWKESVL